VAVCNLFSVSTERFALRMGVTMIYYVVRSKEQAEHRSFDYFSSADLSSVIARARALASALKQRMYVQIYHPKKVLVRR